MNLSQKVARAKQILDLIAGHDEESIEMREAAFAQLGAHIAQKMEEADARKKAKDESAQG